MESTKDRISLANWRREITELYADIRRDHDPRRAWLKFKKVRDELFRRHPQSPLLAEQRSVFTGLDYFDYDEQLRVIGHIDRSVEPKQYQLKLAADGEFRYTRIAAVHFAVKSVEADLYLYWVEGYGGGLFLPFRDRTNGSATFGGGRYLYDSIKGADLGATSAELMLDFNFAYNPSCAYGIHWMCPLSPPENRLTIDIEAGEMAFKGLDEPREVG